VVVAIEVSAFAAFGRTNGWKLQMRLALLTGAGVAIVAAFMNRTSAIRPAATHVTRRVTGRRIRRVRRYYDRGKGLRGRASGRAVEQGGNDSPPPLSLSGAFQ